MNWSDISGAIGKAAPLVGSLLGGKAGGAVGGLVARALGVENDPQSVSDAIAADPEALQRIRELELQHESDLTRMHLEAETSRLTEINKTMRTEAAATDAYVRRWRPTFGYLTAIAWTIQCVAIAITIILKPEQMGTVAQAVTALTPMWGVALAVLGINVTSRSKDKQVSSGQQPASGILASIAKRIGG